MTIETFESSYLMLFYEDLAAFIMLRVDDIEGPDIEIERSKSGLAP